MKRFKGFKGTPVIVLGVLLLISAFIFPSVADNIQTKGIEKAGKDLNINFPKITELVIEEGQEETNKEDIITISDEEEKVFDDIVLLIQKSTLPIALKNRELSESESNRMVELRKKFKAGEIKSEKTMAIGENLEKPYYNPENETYYYPETEMTDEDMLQIIVFDEKLNRAFSRFRETYIQEVMENLEPKISEEEAIKSAKEIVEKVYNVDLDNMKISCSFDSTGLNNKKYWSVGFQPKNLDTLREQEKLYWIYFTKVDIYDGNVVYVDSFYSNQMSEREGVAETDLNNIEEYKKMSEEILIEKLNIKNVEFLKAYVRKPNNLLPHKITSKNLYLVFKAEDRYVEMLFLYGSKRMVGLSFYDDPVELNERINKIEERSIGNIN
ncbi:hypothetical protein RBU61_04200 [Tissierella sp. MB52-C2]|uniref:hypothetical protein n=1 Tax=Tissierella sp. MB52-C2 TaxID=3070999 RepID=UPI00280AE6DD|nr:hypothetical protein [Tissierella sp. MB52-C2]WMM25880.1 hypothetical protein RBU61_04200 [Tissierella sp. MB52-C2]